MLLGNAVLKKKTALYLLTFILTSFIFVNAGQAASVQTDSTLYFIGQTVNLSGDSYGLNELINVELVDQYGTIIDSWTVSTDLVGGFLTKWDVPTSGSFGDTLTFTATGGTTTLEAQTSIVSPKEFLNQLQNGNGGSAANWANGNINSSNSCYAEGSAVSYRYFHKDLDGGTAHYFTIECEATKAGIHALDYFTDYDLTEAVGIAAAGGPCGTISTTPPADCATPSATLAFPDPTVSGNYVSVPTDMLDIVSGSFAVDGPRNMSAYNVVIDSMSQYSFAGTSSDRQLQVTVYFTVVDTGSVGFFWAGHLAEGTLDTWGSGNGSASVSGAPYHMSTSGFDGASGSGEDRSIQGSIICLPPDPTIVCASPDSVCPGSTYTCSAAAGADIYTWSVTGATIVSGQGTDTLTYTVTGITGGTVEISLETCDSTSGCSANSCCADDVVQIAIGDCTVPCNGSITCPPDIAIDCSQSTDTTVTGAPTWSALAGCGTVLLSSSDQITSGACAGSYTISRSFYLVQQSTGDTLDFCTQTITVSDTSAPTFDIACPADATVDCSAVPSAPTMTATDDCGTATVTFNETTTPGACAGSYTITREWTATDDCGNSDVCTQVITVNDTTAPTFDLACPADATVDCSAVPSAPTMTATDDCGTATVTYNETTTPGACAGSYTLTREWTATDDCGNSDVCTQVITVEDTSAPSFDLACPADVTVECDAVPTAPTLTATDDCGTATVTFSESILPGAGDYTITRMWIAVDDCGNADTCTQTITVNDTTPPVFDQVCPADITAECSAVPTAPTLTATDNCDVAPVVTMTESTVAGLCDESYTLTRQWIATDDGGNADTCTQVISVEDTTIPTFDIACPADVTVDCGSVPTAPTMTASDLCDSDPVVSFSETITPGACIGSYTITREWTATDNCSNFDLCTQVITVIDTSPPTFDSTCPVDVTVECDAVPSAPTLTATDDCGTATVSFSETTTPGACAGSYTITREWTATDDCTNSNICTQVITVVDSTDPVCSIPNDTTIVLCDATSICLPVTASDNCSSVSCSITSGPGTLAAGEWCYSASTSESVTVGISCVDECGNACVGSFTVTFVVNSAPQLTITAPTDITLCNIGDEVCATFVVVDPDNGLSATSDIGTVDFGAGTICFNADTSGFYCNTVIVSDSCGLADTASYCVTVTITDDPLLAADANFDFGLLCSDTSDCLDAPALLNAGSAPLLWTVNGLAYSPDTCVPYTLNAGNTTLNFVYIITDQCGKADTASISVTASFNSPPTVDWTPPTTVTLCPDDTTCFGIGGIDDPDNNIASYNLISGPPGSSLQPPHQFCVVGGYSGTAVIIFEVVDSCGASVVDTFTFEMITVGPIEIADASHSIFVCNAGNQKFPVPEIVVGPIDSMHYDGNLITSDSFMVNITSTGSTNHQFIAFGRCDFVDTATITISAVINSTPVLTVEAPDTLVLSACDDSTVCIPFSVVDPDNGFTFSNQLGTLNETLGTICFKADTAGLYCDQVIVSDNCGAADTVDYCILILFDYTCICPIVTLENIDNTLQGGYETITISIDNLYYGMGAYDFLISYDASVLSFVVAEPGAMLLECGWEYFTYRYGPAGNCGPAACPSGVLRITALAETSNGANHPSCFSTMSGDLVDLTFLVSNDRTYECQFAPIRFIWYDCGDNAISSIEGDTLFISDAVYDFDFGLDISDLSASFPSYFGANSSCDISLGDGKPDPIRCIDFVNGGIDIVCADSIDGRGDINLNEVENEIADAVLFSNYFVYGLPVFTINLPGQIAATDVNADGITLSVADLVYLIRVIVGDALPYAKLSAKDIGYTFSEGIISVSGEIGAAAITVSGNQAPSLINSSMDLLYAYDATNDITRILVSSMEPGAVMEGDFLEVGGNLVSIEMATYDGEQVMAKLIPISFGLNQNYPNPFNPTTTISFDLPRAGEYRLTVYNVQGQQVANISGSGRTGHNEITWDARTTASGVYFYRLEAFGKSDVKKMILLK